MHKVKKIALTILVIIVIQWFPSQKYASGELGPTSLVPVTCVKITCATYILSLYFFVKNLFRIHF